MESGYQYTTETQAIAARDQVDAHYNFVKVPEGITAHYVQYYEKLDEEGHVDFYFILHFSGLTEVLGEPVNFEL
jgi:hypothetical protein